ncbi:hypothetical protein Tco_1257869 [Tanacetum coccineum]
MYEARHRVLTRRCISWKRGACSKVSHARSRILVYPDSDEEDEDHVHDTTHGFTSQFFVQSPQTPNLPLDTKDSNIEEILDELFRVGAECLRRIEHEVLNMCDEETFGDTNHESGNLLNFPTFPVTNEFASVCIQDDEYINVSPTKEIEEV